MNLFSAKVKETAGSLLSFLAGEMCLSCGRVPGFICKACIPELPFNNGPRCLRCDIPLRDGVAGNVCGECLSLPPVFTKAAVPFLYQGALQKILTDIKFNGRYYYVSRLFSLFGERLGSFVDEVGGGAVVIPVPLSRRTLLKRGYNQSQLIAREFGRHSGLPCENNLLVKVRDTEPQSGLARGKRFENIRGAFSLKSKNNVEKAVLIDDIITTTATVREAAHVLKKGGINEIYVFALCRTEM